MNATETLRRVRMVGRYGWLGGYAHAVLMGDGELLGAECVAPNYRQISASTRYELGDGWQAAAVVALDDPGAEAWCAHCGRRLQ